MRKVFLITVLALCWLNLASCRPQVKISSVTADELAQVQVYAEPMVENLIQTMLSRDYDKFSKDFNPTMHDVLAKSNFEEMMKTFDEKIGTCTQPKFDQAVKMNDNFALTYLLTCTTDTGVQMQVLFEPDEPHLIAGVFFNSPKLNQ
jgi:hypothetical protein